VSGYYLVTVTYRVLDEYVAELFEDANREAGQEYLPDLDFDSERNVQLGVLELMGTQYCEPYTVETTHYEIEEAKGEV
jgi:hypothetical protein